MVDDRPIVVKVLDTANPTASPVEEGLTQEAEIGWLKSDHPLRVSVKVSNGDVVVFETKSLAANDWLTIKTFTSSSVADLYPSLIWRLRRLTDGGVGESQAWVENRHFQNILEDGAS